MAGPGFVNLRLEAAAQGVHRRSTSSMRARPMATPDVLDGQRINLEFVSANPTGPIHIGGTRWAAVGDALGRLLHHPGR